MIKPTNALAHLYSDYSKISERHVKGFPEVTGEKENTKHETHCGLHMKEFNWVGSIITQLAVYTADIPGIYCILGGYIIPTIYYKQNQNNPLKKSTYTVLILSKYFWGNCLV